MPFERVAITGIGLVSALGLGANETFARLIAGERGIGALTAFSQLDARAGVAAQVKGLDLAALAGAQAGEWSRSDGLAFLAAREALGANAARIQPGELRLGVAVGGTTGGMFETENDLLSSPGQPIDPLRARRLLAYPLDTTSDRIAAHFGAVRSATLCSACSSSALAITTAVGWLASGAVDLVLAGGTDALCRLTFFGFDSLGALDPEPCRPFDRERQGLTLGEGAAFLLLEPERAARARGAEILGFLSAAATFAEAHHITHPQPTGELAAAAIQRALANAGLAASDLDYVNAHGTGTTQNDAMEARALERALAEEQSRVFVSSVKGQLGHTLGAAAAIEAVVTLLALRSGVVPPTVGLVTPEDGSLRHVFERGISAPLRAAVSASFGFGGTGAVLVLEHPEAPARAFATVTAEGLSAPDPGVVVTGAAVLGPFGRSQGAVELPVPALLESGEINWDPRAELDPERSRRFDRAAAFATLGVELALANADPPREGCGLVVGNAFGNVERSVRFVLRAVDRGVRRASPAEFPHLVASAASGNVSIYLGLTGPVLGVGDGGASAEAAVSVALSLLAAGQGQCFVAGGAEGFDPIVNGVLGDHDAGAARVPRSEGAGFLVIETLKAARARGAGILASLVAQVCVRSVDALARRVSAPRSVERARIVTGALTREHEQWLAGCSWSQCTRHSVLPSVGFYEAVGGVALSAAVALLARGEADEALACGSGRGRLWLTHFRRVEPAA
jgi:3-oxoacyl-[acyl-carrier-protein] synthase II